MHFTNTIFSSNSNKDQQIKSSVVFGNMILESTRKAELTADVKSFLDEAKKANAAQDSAKVTQIFDTVKNNYPTQYAEFISEFGKPVSNNSGKKDEEKKSGADALIEFAQDAAKSVGKPARQRFELEKERVKQIALSRGYITSADLAEWFRLFFDKYQLSEENVLKILNIAHNATVKSGADSQTVLSLFSNLYDVFPDIEKIVKIINTTADLQGKYRTYKLFDILRSMSKSPKNNTRYDGEFDNETDNIVWQELKSLVLRAPLEDNSYLSAQWLRSENTLARALEKARRIQQISDQIDSIGNNQVASQLINQIASINKLFLTQSWYKAMQGVIYSLYAGQKAWEVFSAPFTNTTPELETLTRDTKYNLDSQPSSFDAAKQVGSSSKWRVVVAQTSNRPTAEVYEKFEKIKTALVTELQAFLKGLNPSPATLFLSEVIRIFSNMKIDDILSGNLQNALQGSLESVSRSGKIANEIMQDEASQASFKKSSIKNSFIKLSQDSVSPVGMATQAASTLGAIGVTALIVSWFKRNIVALANDPAELLKVGGLAITFITGLLKEEITNLFFGSPLMRDPFFYDANGKPNQAAFRQFDIAVAELGISINDANMILSLEREVTRKLKQIEDMENVVNAQIEKDVQAGSESKIIKAPADSSSKFAENVDMLSKLIANALNECQALISIYDKSLRSKDKISVNTMDIFGVGRRRALVIYEKLKSKRQRYAGVQVTKDQIARFIRLNALLGPIMARVRKFNNLGMSIAPLISDSKSNPNSLLKVMYEIRKNEQKKLDIVESKIKEIKARVPDAESYTDSNYVGI